MSPQVFSYTKKKEIMTDDLCLDVSAHGGPVKLYKCHGMKGNQLWEYDKHSLAIRHVNSNQVPHRSFSSSRLLMLSND